MTHVIDNIEIEKDLKHHAKIVGQHINTFTANDQTYQMLVTSPYILINNSNGGFTGGMIKLPDAQTITVGREYLIFNDSSNTVTIKTFGGVEITKLAKGGRAFVHLKQIVDINDNDGVWTISATSSASFSGTAPIIAYYGGQANTGRILQIIPSVDSEDAPYISPTQGIIIALVLGVGSGGNGTGTVGIFKETDLINPIATISVANENEKVLLDQEFEIGALDRLSVRVTSGSIQKPYLTFYVSAT